MGVVIAWPGQFPDKPRRPIEDGEPRGRILFFTGVRYERPGGVDETSSAKRQRSPRRRKRA